MKSVPSSPARLSSSGLVGLLLLVLIGIAGPAHAKVRPIAEASSAATTDSGEIPTGGGNVSVQLCGGTGGDAFSGSFVVKQGSATGKLVQIYSSGTITGLDGCSATYYIGLGDNVAPFTQVLITRTAGKYSAWLVWNAK